MKISVITILALLISLTAMAAGDQDEAKQAWPMIEDGVLVLDVRSAEEFEEGHIKGAINIHWDEYDALVEAIGEDKQRPVVVYCRSGNRAGKSIEELSVRGYTGLYNATGYEALTATSPSR